MGVCAKKWQEMLLGAFGGGFECQGKECCERLYLSKIVTTGVSYMLSLKCNVGTPPTEW